MSKVKTPLVEKAMNTIRETLYKDLKIQKMVDINEATRKRVRKRINRKN